MTTTDLPASLLRTLPGHYYTDPGIFAAEQTRIFESLCAARCARPNSPLLVISGPSRSAPKAC